MSELSTTHTIIIQNVFPCVQGGEFPAKAVLGEYVIVEADIFTDAHTIIEADLLFRAPDDTEWQKTPFKSIFNDRYRAEFIPGTIGIYTFTINAWVNPVALWQADFKKRVDAGVELEADLAIGKRLLLEMGLGELKKQAAPGSDAFLACPPEVPACGFPAPRVENIRHPQKSSLLLLV